MKAKQRKPYADAKNLFGAIFDPEDAVLVRPLETWFDEKENRKMSKTFYKQTLHLPASEIGSAFNDLLSFSIEKYANIFFGVCPRFGFGEEYDLSWQIRKAKTLWSDIDDIDPEEALERCDDAGLPEPSAVVNTGNGVHLYFFLLEPLLIDDVGDPPPVLIQWELIDGKKKPIRYFDDPTTGNTIWLNDRETGLSLPQNQPALSEKAISFQKTLAGIADKIGGDHTHDLPRLLRVPGTHNRKNERNGQKPVKCELVTIDGDLRYAFSEFERFQIQDVDRKSKPRKRPSPATSKRLKNLQDDCKKAERGKRSERFWALICYAVEKKISTDEIWALVRDLPIIKDGGRSYFERNLQKAQSNAHEEHLVEDPANPHCLARRFLDDRSNLLFWNGEYFEFNGVVYDSVPEKDVKSGLTATIKREFDAIFLSKNKNESEENKPQAVRHVKKSDVSNALQALESICLLPANFGNPPVWISPTEDEPFPLNETIVTQNGILHIPTGSTISLTPNYFGFDQVEYEYDPAAKCPRWEEFLHELWPYDPESIKTLQEIIGYLVVFDTTQQKIFLLIGPKRSGKGTIGRVISGLVGKNSIAAPTLKSLQSQFGLQPLLRKKIAIIGDARLSWRSDMDSIVERLLSISGEDSQTVDQKYKSPITITLPTRFLIFSNELPNLNDASATLVSRLSILKLTESFHGKENTNLTKELLLELPGILNWARDGWLRLQKRGHFLQPHSGLELLRQLEELSSPVLTFAHECCEIGPDYHSSKEDVYIAYSNWCHWNGMNPKANNTFGRDLKAAIPSISDTQRRVHGKQIWGYLGIRLKETKTRKKKRKR